MTPQEPIVALDSIHALLPRERRSTAARHLRDTYANGYEITR